jgi:hypothetical protein
VGHALRLVVIVVVCSCNSTGGTLVLADRPVLEVVVATIDQADLVIAPIAVKSALGRAIRARIVAAVVLENLSWVRLQSHIIASVRREDPHSSRLGLTKCIQQGRSYLHC